MGTVVRLRTFDPPLPSFVSKRNRPIKTEVVWSSDYQERRRQFLRMFDQFTKLQMADDAAGGLDAAGLRRQARLFRQRMAEPLTGPEIIGENWPVDPAATIGWRIMGYASHVIYPPLRSSDLPPEPRTGTKPAA